MFEPHVERLLTELGQLKMRMIALEQFIKGATFAGLPPMKQALLGAQLGAMQSYAKLLDARLTLETKGEND